VNVADGEAGFGIVPKLKSATIQRNIDGIPPLALSQQLTAVNCMSFGVEESAVG